MNSLGDRRKPFDEVAELYERVRSGYPEQLVDDPVWLSGIPDRGRILEIGCGTGKATVAFAQRGYRMTCLEPGPNLARIEERKPAAFADVRVDVCTFEDSAPAEASLDLVLAAQSFHFIEPTFGLRKFASASRL
jgi:SAM-dependent methyltransferase